jgi:SagB-type dehydrogenase family enzyme
MQLESRQGTRAGAAIVFRDDVRVEFDGDRADLVGPVSSIRLRPVRDGLRTVLSRLAGGPTPLADLLEPLPSGDRAQVASLLRQAGHLLAWSVAVGGRELARIEATARGVDHRVAEVADDVPIRLSRFAFCRSRGNGLVLESPLAGFRAVLSHRVAREMVAELGSARTARDFANDGHPLTEVTELLGHLVGAGLVEVGTPDGRFGSDEDPTLRQWDFHDLLFHSRIRSGRYDDPFGAVYPYTGQIEPQPAVKTPPDGPAVPLHRPSLDELLARDPALTVAIEGRRSVRDYDEQPMTAEQLGEFLYRVARVRAHRVPGADGGDEVAARPYPTGGAAYDLELYLSVRRCVGLPEGIYYYDPVAHRLVLVNEDPAERDAMFAVASRSTGLPTRPDVLITVTSRFQRLSWKYRSIAYATTLRHTGVLYQTMYLVAAAMGLAPCGLGNGDADLAARVLGLDYLHETSVGDFMLGSLPVADAEIRPPGADWRMVNSAEWAVRASSMLPRATW